MSRTSCLACKRRARQCRERPFDFRNGREGLGVKAFVVLLCEDRPTDTFVRKFLHTRRRMAPSYHRPYTSRKAIRRAMRDPGFRTILRPFEAVARATSLWSRTPTSTRPPTGVRNWTRSATDVRCRGGPLKTAQSSSFRAGTSRRGSSILTTARSTKTVLVRRGSWEGNTAASPRSCIACATKTNDFPSRCLPPWWNPASTTPS